MSEFSAVGRTLSGVGVIEMTGILDRNAEDLLDGAYAAATGGEAPTVVLLDFTGVTYINSTGIALIVGILARARSEEREVRATGLTEHYQHIFEITRLADLMTFYGSQEEAVGGAVAMG